VLEKLQCTYPQPLRYFAALARLNAASSISTSPSLVIHSTPLYTTTSALHIIAPHRPISTTSLSTHERLFCPQLTLTRRTTYENTWHYWRITRQTPVRPVLQPRSIPAATVFAFSLDSGNAHPNIHLVGLCLGQLEFQLLTLYRHSKSRAVVNRIHRDYQLPGRR
jgi:hypothetical protein